MYFPGLTVEYFSLDLDLDFDFDLNDFYLLVNFYLDNDEKTANHFVIKKSQLKDFENKKIYDPKVDTYELIEDTYIDINEANFPDEIFRQYISECIDEDKDNRLSDTEILFHGVVINTNYYKETIKNLKGINYFKYLKHLSLDGDQLTEIDISENTYLESLSLKNIPVTSIDLSNNIYLNRLTINNTILQ